MASKKAIYAEDLLLAIRDDPEIDGKHFARIKEHISNAQAVDGMNVESRKDHKNYSDEQKLLDILISAQERTADTCANTPCPRCLGNGTKECQAALTAHYMAIDGATPAKPPLIQAKRAIESRYVQSLGVEHSAYEDVLRLIELIENRE